VKFHRHSLREACEREGRSFDRFQHSAWNVEHELAGPYALS
jgi:hypothetical protein